MRLELIDGPAQGTHVVKSPSAGKVLRVGTSEEGVIFLDFCGQKAAAEIELHRYQLIHGQRVNGKLTAAYEYVTPTEIIVFSDGGVTSNPGPAACAAVVCWKRDGQFICEATEALEYATSNQAEYRGLMLGVRLARICGATHVEFRTDSELMARQLAQYAVLAVGRSSTYETRDVKLVELHNRVVSELDEFTEWRILAVPRGQNRRADWLVNQLLRPDSRKGRAAEPAPGE